jgi:hypothetical protein
MRLFVAAKDSTTSELQFAVAQRFILVAHVSLLFCVSHFEGTHKDDALLGVLHRSTGQPSVLPCYLEGVSRNGDYSLSDQALWIPSRGLLSLSYMLHSVTYGVHFIRERADQCSVSLLDMNSIHEELIPFRTYDVDIS